MPLAKTILSLSGRLLAIWLASFLLLLAGLDLFDRLSDSSLRMAFEQAHRDLAGERSPLEAEAAALAGRVAALTGTPALSRLRFALSDRISEAGFRARFNPTSFRITLSSDLSSLPEPERRLTMLHEIAHAVALAKGYHVPDASSLRSPQAREILSRSLLARQIFHESFSDAFAVAVALRERPGDAAAWGEIAQALGKPKLRALPAYETFIAVRETNRRLGFLASLPPERLPAEIRLIASEATPLAIAHLRAEREAACYMGSRSLARFLFGYGYASPTLPWDMAETGSVGAGEPFSAGISELVSLRRKAPAENAWARALRDPSIRSDAIALLGHSADPSLAASSLARGLRLLSSGEAAPIPEADFSRWLEHALRLRRDGGPAMDAALWLADAFSESPRGCR